MKTLIIIDVQNDFMSGGSLAVPQSECIVPVINQLQSNFALSVATQDWHPAKHISFASQHPGKKTFEKINLHGLEQILWPDHCVQGTLGAAFHPHLDLCHIEAIFRKGMDSQYDSYSGFYDNGHYKSTGLAGYLREKGAKELYFCGLCSDICVYYTIQDALAEGFDCTLIEDAAWPLNHEHFQTLKIELLQKNVKIKNSTEMNLM